MTWCKKSTPTRWPAFSDESERAPVKPSSQCVIARLYPICGLSMITAAAYILRVPEHRRNILLGKESGTWMYSGEPSLAEPVPNFEHSRRAPLIVFGCFDDNAITHIASGRKGSSAGTGLVRLNMSDIEPLTCPILFAKLSDRAPARLRAHLNRTLSSGGILPPKTLGALVDIVLELQPDLESRLARFSESRAIHLSQITDSARTNLALQKETLATALNIAGLGTEEVLAWTPGFKTQRSFLEGLPQAYVREDAALIADFNSVPGFDVIKNYPFAAKLFQSPMNPALQLKVIMTNRLPLEKQTGADLIYFNQTYKSFVLVQYKSMDKGDDGPEFRWQPDDKLAEEISRMDDLLEELQKLPSDNSPASFRFHANPFFLKLCPRLIFNPDDKGLFNGIYLPLELWRCLSTDPVTLGPHGGRILTYGNVGRRLTNTDFVTMVANAWVGTAVPQSEVLARVIEDVIQSGKTVTLAVKSQTPTEDTTDETDLN